jgi:hypothetical protein
LREDEGERMDMRTPYQSRQLAKLDDSALSPFIAAFLTIANRWNSEFARQYPDDIFQIACLVAVEAQTRNLTTYSGKDFLSLVNRSIHFWKGQYGFTRSDNFAGESKVQPEGDNHKAFTYGRKSCGIPDCDNTDYGRRDKKYGRLCHKHYEKYVYRKKQGFSDPYDFVESETRLCAVASCDKVIRVTVQKVKKCNPEAGRFCPRHKELVRSRRRIGWEDPCKGLELRA